MLILGVIVISNFYVDKVLLGKHYHGYLSGINPNDFICIHTAAKTYSGEYQYIVNYGEIDYVVIKPRVTAPHMTWAISLKDIIQMDILEKEMNLEYKN